MGSKTLSNNDTLYFGYGSNLWLHQMRIRCEHSEYQGMARLNGYKWIINGRGYANVVQSSKSEDVVWGMVYTLTPEDEEKLDVNEGVPFAYTKETLPVDFWSLKGREQWVNVTDDSQRAEQKMLVYIDRKRVEPAKPWDEYVYRMNMGIKDALKMGLPKSYVDEVMRPFIPDREGKTARQKALEQAAKFGDEGVVDED